MGQTAGEEFRGDLRYKEAKRLLVDCMRDHQSKLSHIRGPSLDLKETYDDYLARAHAARSAPLFFPYVGSGLGNGALVELANGSVKYDLINAIGVHLGHSVPELIEAAFDGAAQDVVMQGNLQQGLPQIELMERLAHLSGLDHCFLTTSGVMAGENALKMALQKRVPANRILAFSRCFMGRTMAVLQITDKPKYRDGLPLFGLTDYVPFCTEESVPRLREYLKRYPGQHAAMVMELVQGEGGIYAGDPKILTELCQLLKEHNIPIIFDEVQTFARTPELFAFHHFGLQEYADMVMIGKLGQVCATLFTKEMVARPGLIAQTFTSSSTAVQTSLALLDYVLNNNYFGPDGHNARVHAAFEKGLKKMGSDLVKGPFGMGSMVAFTALDGTPETAMKIIHALFDAGIVAFTAGLEPTRIRMLLPTGFLKDEQITEILGITKEVLVRIKG